MKVGLFLVLLYCFLYNFFKNWYDPLRIVKWKQFQCIFINITLFCILKYLNKQEQSKVIFMQQFEISLFQFSNSTFTDKRQFSFKYRIKTEWEVFHWNSRPRRAAPRSWISMKDRPWGFYVVYIPITTIFYCPREVVVVGRNKVEHAH
jgi:hypothetical protein